MQRRFVSAFLAADLGVSAFGEGFAVRVQAGFGTLFYVDKSDGKAGSVSLGPVEGPAFRGSGPVTGENGTVLPNESGGDLVIGELGGGTWAFSFGTPSTPLQAARIMADGSMQANLTVPDAGGQLTGLASLTLVPQASGQALAITTRWGRGDLAVFDVSEAGAFTHSRSIVDTAKSYVADIGDTTHLTMGQTSYLLTLSPGENGLTTYALPSDGPPVLIDSLGTLDGLPVNGAAAMQVLQVAGQTFCVVAATGTDSLSVVRINDMGCLFLADHQTDDRSTRFANLASLDVFEANGRGFVVAAGSDGGFSVMEVLPGG